jgi:hypothetical protein
VEAQVPLAAKANEFRTDSKAAAITIMGMGEFVMRSFILCLLKNFDPGFIAGRPDAEGKFTRARGPILLCSFLRQLLRQSSSQEEQ